MAREETQAASSDLEDETIGNGLIAAVSISSATAYFFANPKSVSFYDYTFRVAENMLRGSVAFIEKQPSWLNEFVPFEGFWYSVFPLGAVLSMIPFAVLKSAGIITQVPSALIAALCAGVSCMFLMLIASRYEVARTRVVLMTLGMLLGTWTFTNVTMGGAWQLALGIAFVGLLGALYFTVYVQKPFIAGAFFALAFGNRTEILLTAPVFIYLLYRGDAEAQRTSGTDTESELSPDSLRLRVVSIARFCIVPFVLGTSTLIYNYVRFHSYTDFGYARIPGVLEEPWYKYGIFSYHYIPRQIWEMLLRLWEWRPGNVLPTPNPFSSSILISSPFLLFAFRMGGRDAFLKYLCWASIFVICIVLWMHGNSGGWQFGYRYAIAILPFLYVIMLETAPKNLTRLEYAAYGIAFLLNIYATWLFHWTDVLRP